MRQIMLYEDYQARYDQILQWQVDESGEVVDQDIDCHAMTEVHIQTYRTPSYMLSCAQTIGLASRATNSIPGRRRWASMLSFSRIPVLQTRSRAPTTGLGMASCPAPRNTRTYWFASTISLPTTPSPSHTLTTDRRVR